MLSYGDLRRKEFTEEPYVIAGGLLPKGGLLVVGGAPKSFKSYTLASLAVSCVTSDPALGAWSTDSGGSKHPAFPIPLPVRVAIFENEVGERDMRSRLWLPWKRSAPLNQGLIDSNLWVHSFDFDLMLDSKAGLDKLEAYVSEVHPQVVAIDPLRKFHGSEENSATEMTRVLRALDVLRGHYGVSVILVHHESKPGREGGREGPDALRGSSVLFADGDAFISQKTVNRDAGIVQLSFTTRRTATPKPLIMKLASEDADHAILEFWRWGKWAPKKRKSKGDSES